MPLTRETAALEAATEDAEAMVGAEAEINTDTTAAASKYQMKDLPVVYGAPGK